MIPIPDVRRWIMERLVEYANLCDALGLVRPTLYEWYPSEVPFERFPVVMLGKLQTTASPLAMPELFEERHVYQVVGAVYAVDPRESVFLQEWYADTWLQYLNSVVHRFRSTGGESYYTSETWVPSVTLTPVYIAENPLHGWTSEVIVMRIVRGGLRNA